MNKPAFQTSIQHEPQRTPQTEPRHKAIAWIGGIGFTFMIALVSYGLSYLPGLNVLGQLAWSILIAALFRQIWGYPEKLRAGIQFTAKKLLRLAIILYGLKLNIAIIFSQGLGLLLRDVFTVIFAILITMLLAKWLKADGSLSLLLGIGTGVCGAAAIAAVSPIVKAEDEDTALGAGMIAFIGTVFAVGYTLLLPFLPLTDIQYGIWSGISLHELAHVALAAAPAGEEALAISLLAKLGRVFLLIPLCLVLMYWMRRTGRVKQNSKLEFPWFLLGFIALSLIGSIEWGGQSLIPDGLKSGISSSASFILAMAMVGLGLNIHLQSLRKAWRPLLAVSITSVLLAFITFWMA
ncbi:YeiH family protein [Paenibacillus faecalis]|uniref:YeiH family protein n=1 Tax=Paenibacillus faecalis TaxID=2079532 RepID=UPI000D10003A|nr:putative sulfate exporter family transporter [Paenibacillus faecalis]